MCELKSSIYNPSLLGAEVKECLCILKSNIPFVSVLTNIQCTDKGVQWACPMWPISEKRFWRSYWAWSGCVNYNIRSPSLSICFLCLSPSVCVFLFFVYAFVFLAVFVTVGISWKFACVVVTPAIILSWCGVKFSFSCVGYCCSCCCFTWNDELTAVCMCIRLMASLKC